MTNVFHNAKADELLPVAVAQFLKGVNSIFAEFYEKFIGINSAPVKLHSLHNFLRMVGFPMLQKLLFHLFNFCTIFYSVFLAIVHFSKNCGITLPVNGEMSENFNIRI